jgi:flagellar biosynthesis/type III secretory pathway protein FliH
MSENFRPLFGIETPKRVDTFKDKLQKVLEEKSHLEEELKKLREELLKEKKEREKLERETEHLREELVKREKEVEELTSQLSEIKLKKDFAEKVVEKVAGNIQKAKEELKDEFIEFSKEIIKEFLLTDVVPKEELITRILEEVFEGGLELRGSVRVFLNPSDMDRLFDFMAGIKEKLENRVDIEVVADEELKPGELRIETPKFVLERKHGEIVEDIVREVIKRVFEGS